MVTGLIDYWRCRGGSPHRWTYLSKTFGAYRCDMCLMEVKKDVLKEHTDDLVSRHIKTCENCAQVEVARGAV